LQKPHAIALGYSSMLIFGKWLNKKTKNCQIRHHKAGI
jgi:hypothetical protein